MKCHACGVEVDENGVYCHKCGARLGLEEQGGAAAESPQSEAMPDDSLPDEQPPEPAGTPRERFQEAVAARRSGDRNEAEKDLWQGTYSSKAMVGLWALAGAVSIALLVLGILLAKPWLWYVVVIGILLVWLYSAGLFAYRRLSVGYRLTSKRFFHERGILRHVTDRIEVIDMDDIAFEQTIVDRMVGVGTIRITSSDRSHPILLVPGIENVKEVAGMMDEARLNERMRRGLHIEAI